MIPQSDTQGDASVLQLIKNFHKQTQLPQEAMLDAEHRSRLAEMARSIYLGLQTPLETTFHSLFSINMTMPIRVGIDMGLFSTLASSDGPMTAAQLSEATGGEELLVIRLMRAICAQNFALEIGLKTYHSNDVTRFVGGPLGKAAYGIFYEPAVKPKSNLSEAISFFQRNGYKSPESAYDGIYQRANDCIGLSTWDHWKGSEEYSRFNFAMAAASAMTPSPWEWMEVGDITDADSIRSTNEVFVVDVGGGRGTHMEKLLKRFPSIRGRIVNQDLAEVIEEMDPDSLDARLEQSKHNFFEPQPVKGAAIYYLSSIMHDWPDKEAVKILGHIRDAMCSTSKIWINDLILPDRGSTYR